MATQVQFRRGSSAENDAFTGALGEVTVDTTNDTIRVHDGSTAGGFPHAKLTGTQDITLNGQADLRFGDSDSSNWVAFQAPATIASNVTWTLPNADAGVSGYALVSDAAGTLSWAAAGATVTQDNSTNTNFNLYYASTTSGALTAVKYDGADLLFNPSTSTLTCTNFAGTATSAQYADLAERYTSDSDYAPGTVVVFGGDAEVTQSDSPLSRRIAGIVSTDPAYLMNSALEDGVSVGLVGRVPCKVVGEINKGDMMVSSATPGHACAWTEEGSPPAGSIIGKAIENKTGSEAGVIEVAVGIN